MSATTGTSDPSRPAPLYQRVRGRTRILRVIAGAEFKLKYSGSALGYAWSLIKPFALFTMLYLVFGHIFKLGANSHYYAVSLLIGICLVTFLNDGTLLGMYSLVARESLLRKLAFPRLIIPTSATLTAAITFSINLIAIAGFIAWKHVVPRLDWVLVIPLLIELYFFILAIAIILSTLFVRFRDIGQIWELMLQLLFYASPIVYPVGYLPEWARKIAFLYPFTQVLQDIRSIILYPDHPANRLTIDQAFGSPYARLMPIGIVVLLGLAGLALFRREEPYFAERV